MSENENTSTETTENKEIPFSCYNCHRKFPGKNMTRVYGDNGISFYICQKCLNKHLDPP